MSRGPVRLPCLFGLLASALLASPVDASGQSLDRVLVRSADAGPAGPLSVDQGAVGVWQRLNKVGTTGSVLYTTGHPDDEEAGVLTLLSRGMGARTALLTLNRGEGGANAIGPELFDALGLIRSEELRLAGRYYGLDDQYFTTAVDYGFSKTLDEAVRSWDREAVLGDMVRVIRLNRPLVVISRFSGSARDGHGHHQAAGLLTPEAVAAAADPDRFPEQIVGEGLRPWRVRKLYRARVPAGEPADLELHPGAYSPWLGTSYNEFGAFGLSLQRSQTSGRQRGRGGGAPARYERLIPRDGPADQDPFDGLATTLEGVFELTGEPSPPGVPALLTQAQTSIERAKDAFSIQDPAASAPPLVRAHAALESAIGSIRPDSDAAFILEVERRELEAALASALGVDLEAVATTVGNGPTATMGPAIPGDRLDIHVALTLRGETPVQAVTVELDAEAGWEAPGSLSDEPLAPGETVTGVLPLTIPADAEPSRPWFHRTAISENHYAVRDSSALHLSESLPRAMVVATVDYAGQRFRVARPVISLESQAPFGSARRTLAVAPALSIRSSPAVVIVTPQRRQVSVAVEVLSNSGVPTNGEVSLDLPSGWTSSPVASRIRLDRSGQRERVEFVVTPAESLSGPASVRARVRSNGREYTEGYQRIAHRDLAPRFLYSDATIDVVPVDAVVAPDLVVGYVMGVGDEVPDAIAQLGAQVRLLSEANLSRGDLAAFDAILVGTRAYAVRPDLTASNSHLLDFARAGGNLVVLYQTQEYQPQRQAPYPATLPGNAQEVSEEDAPVVLLAPDHPLLSSPNRIGPADFDGWIEQRGSKFFSEWSAEYTPLIETHDNGQAPQEGVWLSTPVGEGHFTYASIALHRQLPYGVAGAYRILANLLSLGR